MTKASLKSPGSMLRDSAGHFLKTPVFSKAGLSTVDAIGKVLTVPIPEDGKRIFDALSTLFRISLNFKTRGSRGARMLIKSIR